METTKNASESGKTGYGTATTPKKSESKDQSETASSGLSAQIERGEKVVNEVKEKVTDAYDRTSKSLNEGYTRAVDYGRENPGKTSLIIFGAGLGIGLLLANGSGRSRKGRIVTPVMNALTDIASQLFR